MSHSVLSERREKREVEILLEGIWTNLKYLFSPQQTSRAHRVHKVQIRQVRYVFLGSWGNEVGSEVLEEREDWKVELIEIVRLNNQQRGFWAAKFAKLMLMGS